MAGLFSPLARSASPETGTSDGAVPEVRCPGEAPAISSGCRLGPYEVLELLGAGGMGEVYRARDPRLGRDVAIKVLPSSFSKDPDRLRRFEQEARAAGVLSHPNITAVYDVGSQDGAPYVVSELLEGERLQSVLAGDLLSTRRAIGLAIQLAQGLAAAHEKGIVHRDLKPSNVFVTREGRVKILDFGLAKVINESRSRASVALPSTTATEPGTVLGTLGYMAPEQLRGKPADARSDIFSFGAILYEMLSGKRAFRGDSAADTVSAVLRDDPPDLSLTNRTIPPALERIVRHCLEKNPEQRFQSARDLAFDLEALTGVLVAPVKPTAPEDSSLRRWITLTALATALVVAYVAGERHG
jgi:serine/threonine protein kinase